MLQFVAKSYEKIQHQMQTERVHQVEGVAAVQVPLLGVQQRRAGEEADAELPAGNTHRREQGRQLLLLQLRLRRLLLQQLRGGEDLRHRQN